MINKSEESSMPMPLDQQAFMSAMERDAEERHERKRAATRQANALKEQGNEQFRAQNYPAAAELYSQAIQLVRDMAVLYTNRAQCHMRTGAYLEAIADCDWAVRVSDR